MEIIIGFGIIAVVAAIMIWRWRRNRLDIGGNPSSAKPGSGGSKREEL